MTINYYIQCPSCGSVTRMRSSAGYIEKTPIRIHCGECNTLMTGTFICNPQTGVCYFEQGNCQSGVWDSYNFYGEASAEILCHKICKQEDKYNTISPFFSPAIRILQNIETDRLAEYIDYVCHISELSNDWDNVRIIYDLFINKQYKIIKSSYQEDAKLNGYDIDSIFDIQRFIHFKYLYDFGLIFEGKQLERILQQINYNFYHLNKTELNSYIDLLTNNNRLEKAQYSMFSIMQDFVKIALFIMPACSVLRYKDSALVDKENYGLMTCSFNDIKTFYIDTYESLATYCDIIKCLDNIKYRNNYNDFDNGKNLECFNICSNGNKIKELKDNEFFSKIFNIKTDANKLRNAIGHNNYSYNGISQIIKYTPNKNSPENVLEITLLDIAISCIELMKSSIILEFIIYELYRVYYKNQGMDCPLHPVFYKGTHSSNHCPCGSGKKFNKCCKQWLQINQKKFRDFKLPKKNNLCL